MKKSYFKLAAYGLIALLLLPASMWAMKGTISEIPVSTKSKTAMESFRQGLMSMDQNDNQKARTFFMKAIDADPNLAIAYLYKSGTDLTPKEFAMDIQKAKEHLNGASEWERLYFDYASTFLTSDWNKRLNVGTELVKKYPDAARPQVELGFTYVNGNMTNKARACFEKAKQLDPNWIGGYTAMVNTYLFFEPKDFKKAEENALKAVQLAPSSPGARIALGDCYRAEKQLAKAKDAYSKAIDLDPAEPDAYYKKGNANIFMDNYEEARQNFKDASRYDPSPTGAIPFIAYTYLYEGDPKSAMYYYQYAISKLPATDNEMGKINLAKLVYLQDCASIASFNGDATELKELLEEIVPVSEQIGNDIGTQEAKLTQKASVLSLEAMLAALEEKYDLAKSKAEQMKTTLATVTDPLKLDGYEFVLGFINMHQNSIPDAIEHFKNTLQTSVYNKYWLAKAYEAGGMTDNARALYKDLADYNFNSIEYALIRNDVRKKASSL